MLDYLMSWPRPRVTIAPPPARSKLTLLPQLPLWDPTKPKPNGLYYYCEGPRCDVPGGRLCTPLEPGCEDDEGRQLCLQCTRRLWDDVDPVADNEFLSDTVRKFNACTIRKSRSRQPLEAAVQSQSCQSSSPRLSPTMNRSRPAKSKRRSGSPVSA